MMTLEQLTHRARQLASAVVTPELPMVNIDELGILRDVKAVAFDLSQATPGQQAYIIEIIIAPSDWERVDMQQIRDDILDEMDAEEIPARIKTQLEPAWTFECIHPTARAKLRDGGIVLPTVEVASDAIENIAKEPYSFSASGLIAFQNTSESVLELVLEGQTHRLQIAAADTVLDAALAEGIHVPHGCTVGVCGSCRAKVLEGRVQMAQNTTLTPADIDQGLVLTCMAYCSTSRVIVSWDYQ